MTNFLVLFAAIYAVLLVVNMLRWSRVSAQGLVLLAIFAAAIAGGLLHFGVVIR